MKFRSEQGILVEAFSALNRIASNNNAGTPALSGVKLTLTGDTLVAASTDNNMSLQFTLAVGGDTDGQGLISARRLSEIVRVMNPGKVVVEVAGESAIVSAGRSQFTVPTLNAIEFPRISPPAGQSVTLSSSDMKMALSQVVPAASTDSQKPHLSSVLMTSSGKGISLVSTDGYRLALREIAGTGLSAGETYLVPARALAELVRLLDMSDEVTIHLSELDASFQSAAMTLTTRLVNAEFPPYQQIIPRDNVNTITVVREELLDALRRTRVLASDMAPVRVHMSSEGMRLTVQLTDGSASVEDVDAQFEGEDITVAFNSAYLANGVDACGSEEITIATSAPNKPAIIKPVGSDAYLYLLMPQRL